MRIGSPVSGYEGLSRALPAPRVERMGEGPREDQPRQEQSSAQPQIFRLGDMPDEPADYRGLSASARRAMHAYQSTASIPVSSNVEILGLQLKA